MRTTRLRSQFECGSEAQGPQGGRARVDPGGPKDKKRASPDWVRSRATRGLYYCHGHGASDVTETICGHHHFGGEPTGARQRVVDVKSKATLNRNGLAGPDYAGIQLTRGSVPDL